MSFSDFLSSIFVPIGFGVLFRVGWFFADTIGEALVIIADKLFPRKHPKNDEFVDFHLYQDEFHCPFNSKRKHPKN